LAAKKLGIGIASGKARTAKEVADTFLAHVQQRVDAIMVLPDGLPL
jgi:hypothetical protein